MLNILRADIIQGQGLQFVGGVPTAVSCNSGSVISQISNLSAPIFGTTVPVPCQNCPANQVTSCSTISNRPTQRTCETLIATYQNPTTLGFYTENACVNQAGVRFQQCYQDILHLRHVLLLPGGDDGACTPCPQINPSICVNVNLENFNALYKKPGQYTWTSGQVDDQQCRSVFQSICQKREDRALADALYPGLCLN